MFKRGRMAGVRTSVGQAVVLFSASPPPAVLLSRVLWRRRHV